MCVCVCVDTCEGHVMHQSCLMRYETMSGLRIIIMQPMPEQFDTIVGHMNLFRNASTAKSSVEQCADDMEVMTGSAPSSADSNKVEAHAYQKLANGVVIKMLEYPDVNVNYVAVLQNPNHLNPCLRSNESSSEEMDPSQLDTPTLCPCPDKGVCNECFKLPTPDQINHKLIYVAFNFDSDPTAVTKKNPRSGRCNDIAFYQPYDFTSTPLGE